MPHTNFPPQIPRSPALFKALVSRQTFPFFLRRMARNYGDLFQLRPQIWVASHPELVQQVLVANPTMWSKSRGIAKTKSLLGEGLLGSEGGLHRSRRRLLQPLFSVARLPLYADTIVDCALETRNSWKDGTSVDIATEMSSLALRIVTRSVFGSGVEGKEEQVAGALDETMHIFDRAMTPWGNYYERLPSVQRRFAGARSKLDEIVYSLIEQTRREGATGNGVVDVLLRASDEEGLQLDDEAIRDEAMTLLLAGHETTANALAFAWWFLGRYSWVRRRLEEEVDAVLGKRRATFDDLRSLVWTRAVLSETMRLLPPAWIVARQATQDIALSYKGREIIVPAGTTVMASSFVVHRDARFWKNPLRFDPTRWMGKSEPVKWSYFPFGGGHRACLAENFAWMEATLSLATLAQEFKATSDNSLKLQPSVTLRPLCALPICVEKR